MQKRKEVSILSAEFRSLFAKWKNNYLFAAIFLGVAIVGLFIVKWNPYFHKAFLAASKHSIGASIVTGNSISAPEPSWNAALGFATAYFKSVWQAVVLGLLLGSLVQVLIPAAWVKRVMGKQGLAGTAIAGAAALPGMMCTCCAAPVAAGLRKQSASINSALAFFLANPVLNPATIVFMGFVLSWKFALFRVMIGVALVLFVATLGGKLAGEGEGWLKVEQAENEVAETFLRRWLKALRLLIIDTIPAYLVVVLLLGAFRAWLFPVLRPEWSNGLLVIIGLAVSGTLFVIPTAAEIPIVQTMMSFGLGVGPAATLLITLPAVSLPSLLIVKRAFPAKVLVFTAFSVMLFGIVSGYLAAVIL